jgi:hypothetical protein
VSVAMSVFSTRFNERIFISQPIVVTIDLISRSVGRPAHMACSPAPQGRSVMRNCLHSTYSKLLDYIRMAIENSGRIKHLKKIGSLGEIYLVRTGYHWATRLRYPLTKYWISIWPSITSIPRRNR